VKRPIIITVASCALAAVASVAFVQRAASQARISTSPQIQVVGAAANSHSHAAWFVDIQSATVVFCERLAKGIECSKTPLP
jgi:hypothetical protein